MPCPRTSGDDGIDANFGIAMAYLSARASFASRESADRSCGAANSINALTLGNEVRPAGVSK